MSDAEKAYQATPASTLEGQIMNPCIAKNEREWWAAAEIERLRAEVKLIIKERDRTFALMLHRAEKAEAALERAAVHFESLNKQAYAVIARAALAEEKKK
jgi:hypothetical protein